MADTIRRSPSLPSDLVAVAGIAVSAVPMLILVLPAIVGLPAVEPLLHESEVFPGFSRASLVAIPLAGLVVINLLIFAATRSLRGVMVASVITSTLAPILVLGAVDLVNDLNEMFPGGD